MYVITLKEIDRNTCEEFVVERWSAETHNEGEKFMKLLGEEFNMEQHGSMWRKKIHREMTIDLWLSMEQCAPVNDFNVYEFVREELGWYFHSE
jgi:hypothetical protein